MQTIQIDNTFKMFWRSIYFRVMIVVHCMSDTLYDDTGSVDTESVALDEEDLDMTVDEGIRHFQKWKNGCTIVLDEELAK